jgi:hypothetical protein
MTEEAQTGNAKLDLAAHLDKCSPRMGCAFGCPGAKRLREEAARTGELETPESIEARAAACMERGECTAGAHLRGYASGIREGEWRAKVRMVAALRERSNRSGNADMARAFREAADDLAAGRL